MRVRLATPAGAVLPSCLLLVFPSASYPSVVADAAATGNLPGIPDFDGPYLYNYAYYGMLAPLDSCVPRDLAAHRYYQPSEP
jgi:hypothetical protein